MQSEVLFFLLAISTARYSACLLWVVERRSTGMLLGAMLMRKSVMFMLPAPFRATGVCLCVLGVCLCQGFVGEHVFLFIKSYSKQNVYDTLIKAMANVVSYVFM